MSAWANLSLRAARAVQRRLAPMEAPAASFYPTQPLILAHRGARTQRAENTLGAFALGMKQGAHGVELDVHLTADRAVVVFHDATLARLGQPQVELGSLTLAQVQQLDVRALVKDGPAQAHPVRIPTLQQVFEVLPQEARINVELKGGGVWGDGLEVESLRMVARARAEERVIYSAFHPSRLLRLRALAPDAHVGMLHEPEANLLQRHLHLLPLLRPHALHPHTSMVDEAYMAHARRLRLAVHVWTVNTAVDMLRLAHLGVEAIITDVPELAVATLKGFRLP